MRLAKAAQAAHLSDPAQRLVFQDSWSLNGAAAHEFSAADRALLQIGAHLKDTGYNFTTITPASHQRIMARASEQDRVPQRELRLEDVFGWSRPFTPADIPQAVLGALAQAGELQERELLLCSNVRYSTLGGQIFVHSAYPTETSDAVFFGPDTYRFARMLRHSLAGLKPSPGCRIVDIGAGSGAGGLYAAAMLAAGSPTLVLSDINPRALRFCRINAALNGVPNVQTVESDLFMSIEGTFDLVISNPPYLVDPLARLYRHGGGELGFDLSLRIVEQGIARLRPGGRLLLYTGSAIVGGVDRFHAALRDRLDDQPFIFTYEEIDPDVFGEELEHPPYDRADRIAVVGVTVEKRPGGPDA
jgi:methylase of polypeptide subunit release factors